MKKRLISIALVILTLSLCASSAFAKTDSVTPMRFSWYLDQYSVGLGARANHQMSITMSVDGTGMMTKIGVSTVYIEHKINGTWCEFDTLFASDHPAFYQYNTDNYLDTVYFTGTQGVQYRVTITAYARNSSGSDTGKVTSYIVTCK